MRKKPKQLVSCADVSSFCFFREGSEHGFVFSHFLLCLNRRLYDRVPTDEWLIETQNVYCAKGQLGGGHSSSSILVAMTCFSRLSKMYPNMRYNVRGNGVGVTNQLIVTRYMFCIPSLDAYVRDMLLFVYFRCRVCAS